MPPRVIMDEVEIRGTVKDYLGLRWSPTSMVREEWTVSGRVQE